MSLLVEISEAAWLQALPDIEMLAEQAVAAVIMERSVEIGLTFADDDFVKQLNRDYRGKDKPTNVLSFPVGPLPNLPLPVGEAERLSAQRLDFPVRGSTAGSPSPVSLSHSAKRNASPTGRGKTSEGEGVISLGDIVLAFQTVAHEARQENKTLAAHTQHLIVHGVLHLLGHDHENETDAEAMETLEIEILDAIGIANPYTITSDA